MLLPPFPHSNKRYRNIYLKDTRPLLPENDPILISFRRVFRSCQTLPPAEEARIIFQHRGQRRAPINVRPPPTFSSPPPRPTPPNFSPHPRTSTRPRSPSSRKRCNCNSSQPEAGPERRAGCYLHCSALVDMVLSRCKGFAPKSVSCELPRSASDVARKRAHTPHPHPLAFPLP